MLTLAATATACADNPVDHALVKDETQGVCRALFLLQIERALA